MWDSEIRYQVSIQYPGYTGLQAVGIRYQVSIQYPRYGGFQVIEDCGL
jgi:hypothetical protein